MWLQSIQQAINYIEEHLTEPIHLTDVAKAANCSPFHFQRAFSILTNMTLGEYIRGRRLTLAAQDIKTTDCKIIDIAYKYGYETPEAFAKAFRKQHGFKPTEMREESTMIHAYNKLVIQVTLKGASPMHYKILEKPSFTVIGLKQTFPCGNGEQSKGIQQFWKEVNEDGTVNQLIALHDGSLPGLVGVCEAKSDNEIDYWIAVGNNGAHDIFTPLTIAASKWAIFEVQGAMPQAMVETWQKIFQEWFPSNNFEYGHGPELEIYPAGDTTSPDYYSEIWVPIK